MLYKKATRIVISLRELSMMNNSDSIVKALNNLVSELNKQQDNNNKFENVKIEWEI
jgi:ABC-type transport system involved in cytochrome bd biosynthesis fused ATPase/permease subunit